MLRSESARRTENQKKKTEKYTTARGVSERRGCGQGCVNFPKKRRQRKKREGRGKGPNGETNLKNMLRHILKTTPLRGGVETLGERG